MDAMYSSATDGVQLRPLARRHDFDTASVLYRQVFGYDDRFSLNSKLMRSMVYAGGAHVGAWNDDGELVGFVYGFPAWEDDRAYLFSQASCVSSEWRGRGVGSALKYAQMAQARARGLSSMRWAFDPTNFRNARMNLNKLGARARWYKPDFYDDGSSDRLLVEWDGSVHERTAVPAVDGARDQFGLAQMIDDHLVAITAPDDEQLTDSSREAFATSLRQTIEDGFAAVQCISVSAGVVAYLCERSSA